jgi:hypothetical protein
MKIKTHICNGYKELEYFLNNEIDYKGFRYESIILGITQNDSEYTIIYKDLNDE